MFPSVVVKLKKNVYVEESIQAMSVPTLELGKDNSISEIQIIKYTCSSKLSYEGRNIIEVMSNMQLQMNMLTTFNSTDNTLICEGCNIGVY